MARKKTVKKRTRKTVRRAATKTGRDSAREVVDRALVASGTAKMAAGHTPTHHEMAAIERRDKVAVATMWHTVLHTPLPKKFLCDVTGRQVKTLNEQAVRYGLPIGHATWLLGDTLHAIWDFIARAAPAVAKFQDSHLDWDVEQTPALERLRLAKAQIEELNLAEKRGQLIDLSVLRDLHTLYAGMLRACGDQLRKHFGDDAADLLNEAITAGMTAMNDRLLGEVDSE